jgi:hypothetical protein
MGVLSNSQTVGVNVGVRSPEANKLQQGGKRTQTITWWECTKSDISNFTYFHPLKRGARAVLFIGGAQQSYYNALNVPNYLPRQ